MFKKNTQLSYLHHFALNDGNNITNRIEFRHTLLEFYDFSDTDSLNAGGLFLFPDGAFGRIFYFDLKVRKTVSDQIGKFKVLTAPQLVA